MNKSEWNALTDNERERINKLFWFYSSYYENGAKVLVQHNGTSDPVAKFTITSIKEIR